VPVRTVMSTRERLAGVVVWTIAATVAVTALFASWGHLSWRQVLEHSTANALFSGICVTLCVLVLPKIAPWAHRRLPAVLAWSVIAATLAVLGTAGSLIATATAVVLRILPASRFFAEWYPVALRTSIYFTLIFGLAGTMIQQLRFRLASTTVALRTKERDEAEARRLVAEAQLASLEARVDPHFLFNTLNSIAALVRDRPADAERVIEQLSSLMRSSLDRRASSLVTLDEELALVRSYLEIERIRFGERLRFRVESPSELGSALVPRLSLQTLVENCVKYAVSPSREGAAVAVRAAADGGRLHLSVEDDGPGFDSSHLPESHGLHLLKSRLAMTFGDRAAFRIDSKPGRTSAALDLPLTTVPPVPQVENRIEMTSKDLGCP
jgi:sensor histidine kinase YesM